MIASSLPEHSWRKLVRSQPPTIIGPAVALLPNHRLAQDRHSLIPRLAILRTTRRNIPRKALALPDSSNVRHSGSSPADNWTSTLQERRVLREESSRPFHPRSRGARDGSDPSAAPVRGFHVQDSG